MVMLILGTKAPRYWTLAKFSTPMRATTRSAQPLIWWALFASLSIEMSAHANLRSDHDCTGDGYRLG